MPRQGDAHGSLVLYMLAHCHGLLGRLNGTEPSFMFLVTPMLFLLRQVKMSAVKKIYAVY